MLHQILGQAKKYPSLILHFVFIGAESTGAALCILHLALFNPDVCWDRKDNPESWNKLGPNDQYKFYSMNLGYSKLKREGPDFLMKCFTEQLLRMKVFQRPSAPLST
ncbi:NADH dehydrogenase [ubiquinone] 1 alpha subcomplex subunit 4 [Myotis brandtii]|uniref:Cytochrome c oxidase subunit NDUFA4 n=1 Tax=Myotis brandtii TaxID=109478 RepID=S7PH97_MYOBR|nr:PREDICTED: cytochrome c oxidase subunit NDUFA4 [Myotis brandtii]EPQ10033.1 NADH dehydrogenase [ubiquinone] 1 alpha subcomplex subunit 4 [Myotis brandtii]